MNFGSMLSWPLILIGLLVGGAGSTIVNIGIWMFVLVVLFQLITLPVEFNASGRALRTLDERAILQPDEVRMSKKVLSAAAMTYVAAMFSALMSLLRLILIVSGGRRRNN